MPADDVDALNLAHTVVLEVGHDFQSDQVVLVTPRALAQTRPHAGLVHLVELSERHVHGASSVGGEVVLPRLGFFRSTETALALVHFVAEFVLAPELREPGAVLRLLNGYASPLPSG